ncbi:CRISPR-associated protein Csm1 [Desulfacinum infernum DSM 9756]|uniref:CRISPR system single-strand-specific deoxyribonuclease Cas10/Csm1 (subtype III-A) n=1 Tax=Desulfacinum infernum DSM 9756 TaxID=1121391 RepID=A0A1M5AVY0_9BACT|nr:type III-A CRISPR-associated protein Cas10/Csm1 [Desulfacinum infernum]SHF34082.1 CRISPR-associated protein Csm1 [Desulfacinum infernum DSM 9756]
MLSHEKRRSLCLAGLFHDLGKFKQRAERSEDRGKTHGEIGYRWLQGHYGENLVALGAKNHHASDEHVWEVNDFLVLYEADNCSASERRTTYDNKKDVSAVWQRDVPLASVFSRVRNPHEDDPHALPPPAFWELPRRIGPRLGWQPPKAEEGQNPSDAYGALWQGFELEFQALKACGNHHNVDSVMHLLEKYTGTVPSMTLRVRGTDDKETYRKHPDVSLFDHLKTTAAFTLCLADFCWEKYGDEWSRRPLKEEIAGAATWGEDAESPFLLVGGDLSGVQRFLYTISAKGALKSLKGRSFFLELFLEHAVDTVLESLGLFRCNVIFTGGGHFYLVAANTRKTEEALREVKGRLNRYLFHDFNGALELFLCWVPFRKADLKDVTEPWQRLSGALEEAKKRKGENFLAELLGEPQDPHPDCYTDKCQVCGREDRALEILAIRETAITVCEPCRDQYYLGDLLQQAARKGHLPVIYRWDREPEAIPRNRYIRIEDRFYQPAAGYFGRKHEELNRAADAVFHLNDWDLSHFQHPGSRPLFAGVYLPPEDAPRDLESMAERGFGMGRIGVVRMDVDRLGRIFSLSLPPGERTFSLTASLSRQLSLFFKYHINGILEGAEGYPEKTLLAGRPAGPRLTTVVYSGGDDLFLIGHWLDTLEAALDIQKAFAAFTANPFITISAGMAVGSPHEPVYRLADAAGEAERLAKRERREGAKTIAGRQSFTLLGRHVFPWKDSKKPDVAKVLEALKHLEPFVDVDGRSLKTRPHGLSKGFYYKLLQLVRRQRQDGVWLLPKLAYLFGRTKVDGSLEEHWGALKHYIFSSKADGWRHVEAALLILLMMMREGGSKP